MFNNEKTMFIPSIEVNPEVWDSLIEYYYENFDGILNVW